ncbi:MAG: SUMF1/EgtB/PvdO family nonheme iron enzyme [Planctomycetia bacterium]|nr:SUMF1/EgtB/PvdO family nonheme iron enzyme [Planctomycetia bacterium]
MKRLMIFCGVFLFCFCGFIEKIEQKVYSQEIFEKQIGLILDQPAKVVMLTESDIVAEIATELDRQNDSFAITILNPSEKGFVLRNGEPVSLDSFDLLWIHQGDEIVQNSPLFCEKSRLDLQKFNESRSNRGILLSGGSVALMDSLGYGPIQTAPVTFGEDRAQAGLIPVQPQASSFQNVQEDRGTLWITNAAFPAFNHFQSTSPLVKTLAETPEAPANPLLVGVAEEGTELRAKVIAFGWRVSLLFDHAATFFQNNLKTLFVNLLNQTGQTIASQDFVAPAYRLPDFDALQRSLSWMIGNFDPEDYPRGNEFQQRLEELQNQAQEIETSEAAAQLDADFAQLQREALLANPIVDFDEILFLRRHPSHLGLPQNYNSNSVISPTGYQNEVCRFNLRTEAKSVVYKPKNDEFVGDLELYYDADKLMFSMPDVQNGNRWRLWELFLDSPEKPVLLPLINDPDIDNYDGCYLPDDRIVFCSTACQTGVPCIDGTGHVCNLYLKEHDNSIRQLTLEQDHDWCPTVMNNGRIMYLRWEYTDLPHAFSRILFHANPDGTNQSELYGSGSYWPGTMFYARPIPDHPTKFVAIVGGHHELERRGDLVLFDPALGRFEAEGAIQRIPGFDKKVEPVMIDLPIAQTWPKFLHPFPLSENYFIVSCQRSKTSPWEICLVDSFDNIVTLLKESDFALLEPIPLRETECQPIIPDRVRLKENEADVFIADIYEGEGLIGVPRGEVKSIRIFSYQFSYQEMGAEPHSVGLDGPWDPKRILGTVPVYEDGSAAFKIPAYTPIALQPLDKNGKAIQLMRSWITAMPGESVSCIGCHEKQNSTSPTIGRTIGAQSAPVEITPFYGSTRGFSFDREIQPILDHYCVDCHQPNSPTIQKLITEGLIKNEINNSAEDELKETVSSTYRVPDFRQTAPKPLLETNNYINQNSRFSESYYQLRRFVRTQTKESQMPIHRPYEFHADTDYLIQLLEKDHFGVTLDQESWDKLISWIDLNAPYYGNWGDIRNYAIADHVEQQWSRREELRQLYTGLDIPLDDDPTLERSPSLFDDSEEKIAFSLTAAQNEDSNNWKLSQGSAETNRTPFSVPLSDKVELKMVPIPGTTISIGQFEITNEQYRIYDPSHDSGIEYGDFIQFSPGEKGWLLSRAQQPVVRVTWNEAQAFCVWLSEKTGKQFKLPTKDQWQFAASGGTDSAFWFGDENFDYSTHENLGDSSLAAIDPFGWTGRVETLPAWRPADMNRNDRSRVSAPVGSYSPNPFGLFDMQGNVSEWTDSEVLLTKKVIGSDGKDSKSESEVRKVVCGGSWYTPIRRASLDQNRHFPAYYNIYDVGFRVMCVE